MSDIIHGFEPFCGENSIVLILGSFPSVKSRETSFYYGNPRNRFWQMLSSFFGKSIGESVPEKKKFLLDQRIALWDVVSECSIRGSSDASITGYRIADLSSLSCLKNLRAVLLNGSTAARIFEERYADFGVPYFRMPSTSPANPHYDSAVWHAALRNVFGG